jgi:hypothetical protein
MKTSFKISDFRFLISDLGNTFHVTLVIILFILISPNPLYGQIYSEKDVEICNSKFSLAFDKNLSSKPMGDVIAEIGRSFIGTDYEAQTLEKDGEEQLVINLTGFDCTTLLENELVFARLIKKGKTTFEDYQKELTYIRYRDGIIKEYPSRLHYFSDWIYNNQQKGIVKDITRELGGEPIKFDVNFMSTHPDAYKHLRENAAFIPIIEKQEKEISNRTYFYIPEERIASLEDKIRNGDLIAFTTGVKGLDIGHTGIAVKEKDGRIHLLHAPNVGYKVYLTEDPLAEYVKKTKRHTGIIVLRATEPKSQIMKKDFRLEEGDLIFQDLDCGPLCDAIEKVTDGFNGADFSHIGLVVKDSTNQYVILEAMGDKVQTTPLDKFLNRSFDANGNPKAIVGRVKPEYKNIVSEFVEDAKTYLGKPYDDVYVMDNDSFYCSELIYLAALKANNGIPFFYLDSMTFKDPDTGDFNPAWVEYYKNLNVKIPEGEAGINPGGISLSDKIEIIHVYGYPDGWMK